MPNQNPDKGLSREDFARAWATGSSEEQGRMLFDLVERPVRCANEAKQEVAKIRKHIYVIWGGIAVVAVVGAPIILSALNVVGGK